MPQTSISFEQLSKYFHLPINDVAKELGICATMLKKICRRNGIPRWPHRKIKSLNKMIENLESSLQNNTSEAEDCIKQEINILKNKKTLIMKNPSILASGSSTKRSTPSTPIEMERPVKKIKSGENEPPLMMTKVSPSAPPTPSTSLSINQLLTPSSNPFATPLTSYLDPEEDAHLKNLYSEHHSSVSSSSSPSAPSSSHWQPLGYNYPPHGSYPHPYGGMKGSYQQHPSSTLPSHRPVSPPPAPEYAQRSHLAYITSPHSSSYGVAPQMEMGSYTLPKMNMPPYPIMNSGSNSPPPPSSNKYQKGDSPEHQHPISPLMGYQQQQHSHQAAHQSQQLTPEHMQYAHHYKSHPSYRQQSSPPPQAPQNQQQTSPQQSAQVLRWVMEYDKKKHQ